MGSVAKYLSIRYDISTDQIATMGDMAYDVLMFAHDIAMGSAGHEVQRAARPVAASNDDEGFSKAVERSILGGGRTDS
jgi:hydroxymethylpyrimidine pyrophosphatase-like HAD family hydrolase